MKIKKRAAIMTICIVFFCLTELLAANPGSQNEPAGPPSSFTHEKKFSVITMGTNCPVPNPDRASASTMIQYNGKYFVVDTGNGSGLNFIKGGYAYSDIRAILFTHLHVDHTADFFNIMIERWMTGGKKLDIIGTPRTGQMYDFLMDFYSDDLVYRMIRARTRGVNKTGMFEDVTVKELTGENRFVIDGLNIRTAEMTHTMYNLAYRFDTAGKSIVVSGDTSFDEDLITLADNAEILVMDGNINPRSATAIEEESKGFTDNSVKPKPKHEYSGNFNVPPHVNLNDIINIAKSANVRKLVLTHFTPEKFNEKEIRHMIRKGGYPGEVIFGTDTMEINP